MKIIFSLLLTLLLLFSFYATATTAEDLRQPTSEEAALLDAREAQQRIDQLTDELMRKLSDMEVEYNKKKLPSFQKRNSELKRVKGFWGRVISSHPSHGNWIRGPTDRQILPFITDVIVSDPSTEEERQMHHYRVELHFDPNPYFSDSALWRDVHGAVGDDAPVSGVHWLSGMDPNGASFFNFFQTRESMPEHYPRLDHHTLNEVAHVIRYEFWPNPFTYHDIPSYATYLQEAHREFDQLVENQGENLHELDQHTFEGPPLTDELLGLHGAVPAGSGEEHVPPAEEEGKDVATDEI